LLAVVNEPHTPDVAEESRMHDARLPDTAAHSADRVHGAPGGSVPT
jgi:hypothetical protein